MFAVLVALALQAGSVPALPVPAPAPPPASVEVEGVAGGTLSLVAVPGMPAATLSLRRRGQPDATAQITTVQGALTLLADPRMAPLWPALIRWAGADLTALRDAHLARARAIAAEGETMAAATTLASSVRPATRAALLLADALWGAGQRTEAERVVAAARGTSPKEGDWGRAEWAMTSLRLANLRQERGDAAGALAMLDASAAAIAGSPYALNMQVNRAVYLLEMDRAAEALAEIDSALAAYRGAPGGRPGRGGEKVPGSDRQFAWIRACALVKLGRRAEAAAAAAPLATADEPTDAWLVVQPNAAVRMRYARCIGDVGLAARLYADELRGTPVGGGASIQLQPGRRRPRIDPAFDAEARRHPALAPLLAERMRTLPPQFTAALNGWPAGTN